MRQTEMDNSGMLSSDLLMHRSDLQYIDLTLWSAFQADISQHLDVSVGLYDDTGRALIPPSGEGKLCEILKQSEKGSNLYRESYKKVIARAIQRKEPYHYKCFTGQCIFVIPITLAAQSMLFIIGGHVYLPEDQSAELDNLSEELKIEGSILREIEGDTRTLTLREFFSKLNVVKKLAAPFLKSLYQKGHFEKEFSQMKTMIQVSTSAGFPENREALYRNVFNSLGVLFDIDGASVMELSEKGGYETMATFGPYREVTLTRQDIEASAELRRIIDSRKPLCIERHFDLSSMKMGSNVTSAFVFPMTVGDELLGFLSIYNTVIGEDSVALITMLVAQLSIIVKSVRREKASVEKLHKIDSIAEIHRLIAPLLNPDELFDVIMDKSVEIAGAEQGSLMLLEGEDPFLSVKASRGIDKSFLESVRVRVGEGISGRVAKEGEAMMINDIEHQVLNRKNRSRYKTKSFVSFPLKIDKRTIGVINISDKISGEIFSQEDLALLQSFSCYASMAIERGTYFKMTQDLKEISSTDSLTGLMNRGAFHERLIETVARSKRYNESFTVFMIDIDDFKLFNDQYGHLAGDEALKKVAYAVKDGVRTIDLVGRVGGEEICVLLPNTKMSDSYVIAERMRKDVEMVTFIGDRVPQGVKISVSIGIAEYPAHGENAEDVLHRADMAMYAAKGEGKNKVVTYGSTG